MIRKNPCDVEAGFIISKITASYECPQVGWSPVHLQEELFAITPGSGGEGVVSVVLRLSFLDLMPYKCRQGTIGSMLVVVDKDLGNHG